VDLQNCACGKRACVAKAFGGVAQLAKLRGGRGLERTWLFWDSNTLRVETSEAKSSLITSRRLFAVGSKSALPKAFESRKSARDDLARSVGSRRSSREPLVIGGGYLGMELGTVYASLGSRLSSWKPWMEF